MRCSKCGGEMVEVSKGVLKCLKCGVRVTISNTVTTKIDQS